MAKKKNEVKEPDLTNPEASGILALNREEIHALEKAQLQAELAGVRFQLVQAMKREYIAKIDPQGNIAAMDDQAKRLSADASEAKQSYANTVAAIEKRLGVKMSDYAWDDETGVLTPAGP